MFQKLHSSLSSDRRLPELVVMVTQLPSSGESEEAATLARSVDDLVAQHAATLQQVAARQTAVDDRLRRWTYFDESYQKLLAALSVLQIHTDAMTTFAAEDAITTIENVSVLDHT